MERPKSTVSKSNYGFSINDCERPNTSVFRGDKTKSSQFFKNTKVESCSHIVEHKGRTFAIPYKVTNSKGRPLSSFKYNIYKKPQEKSIYQMDYSVKPIMHAGMIKKPLVKYDPNSFRNKLPKGEFYMPHKNTSMVNLGIKTDINKKQWLSTAKDSFQWPKPIPISNTGILATTFKNHHKKLISYQ